MIKYACSIIIFLYYIIVIIHIIPVILIMYIIYTHYTGIQIPDNARIVLYQEDKYKKYYNELQWTLSYYDRIVTQVIPVTAMVRICVYASMCCVVCSVLYGVCL